LAGTPASEARALAVAADLRRLPQAAPLCAAQPQRRAAQNDHFDIRGKAHELHEILDNE